MYVNARILRKMLEPVRLQVFEMIHHQFGRKRILLTRGDKLSVQAFFHIERTATHRFEVHHDLPRRLGGFDGTFS
jgi:hypothetical protein